jgi:hypothetical protein
MRSDLGQGLECLLAILEIINPTFQSSKHLILDIGSSCAEIGMMERLQHLVKVIDAAKMSCEKSLSPDLLPGRDLIERQTRHRRSA